MEIQESLDALGPVCSLDGRARATRIETAHRFVARATDVATIPRGVRLRFPRTAESARAIVDFIRAERECCGGVAYEIGRDPREGRDASLDLEIVGGEADAPSVQAFYLALADAARASA